METITFQVENKYVNLFSNQAKTNKIMGLFLNEYSEEIYEDNNTRKYLENSDYDKSLNTQLKAELGI